MTALSSSPRFSSHIGSCITAWLDLAIRTRIKNSIDVDEFAGIVKPAVGSA
jgi:hypothetical protein